MHHKKTGESNVVVFLSTQSTCASHVVVLSLYAPADYPFFAIKI